MLIEHEKILFPVDIHIHLTYTFYITDVGFGGIYETFAADIRSRI